MLSVKSPELGWFSYLYRIMFWILLFEKYRFASSFTLSPSSPLCNFASDTSEWKGNVQERSFYEYNSSNAFTFP